MKSWIRRKSPKLEKLNKINMKDNKNHQIRAKKGVDLFAKSYVNSTLGSNFGALKNRFAAGFSAERIGRILKPNS